MVSEAEDQLLKTALKPALQEALKKAFNDLEQLKNELTAKETAFKALEDKSQKDKEKLDEIDKELYEKTAALTELQKQFDKLKEETEDAKNSATAEKESREAEVLSLKEKCEQLEKQITDLEKAKTDSETLTAAKIPDGVEPNSSDGKACVQCDKKDRKITKYKEKMRSKENENQKLQNDIQDLHDVVSKVSQFEKDYVEATASADLNYAKAKEFTSLARESESKKQKALEGKIQCVQKAALIIQKQAKIPESSLIVLSNDSQVSYQSSIKRTKSPSAGPAHKSSRYDREADTSPDFDFAAELPPYLLDFDNISEASSMRSTRGFNRQMEYETLAFVWKHLSHRQQVQFKSKPNSSSFLTKCFESYENVFDQDGRQTLTSFIDAYTKSTPKHKNAVFKMVGLEDLCKS